MKNLILNLLGLRFWLATVAPSDWPSNFWATAGNQNVLVSELASAATIAPQTPIVYVTGTTAVTLITQPWAGFVGAILIHPAGAAAYNTGGSADGLNRAIGVAYTSVANRPFLMYCNGTTWYPMAIA